MFQTMSDNQMFDIIDNCSYLTDEQKNKLKLDLQDFKHPKIKSTSLSEINAIETELYKLRSEYPHLFRFINRILTGISNIGI